MFFKSALHCLILFCIAMGLGVSTAYSNQVDPCYPELYLNDNLCGHCNNDCFNGILDTIQIKIAGFHPCSKKIRRIYPNWLGLCGGEITGCSYWGFSPWISASYLGAHGHSIGGNHSTDLNYVPIGFGVNYMKNINCTTLYLGIGGLWSYLKTKNHSNAVIRSNSRWDFGGIIKAGAIVYNGERSFISIFADYSFMKFDSHGYHHGVYRQTADLSGYSIGASIGFKI